MSYRITLPALLSALAVCAGPLASSAPAQDKKPRRPNVVFILADDLGYGDVGCYGQKLFKTPNIDRLAREGVRFTQVYAGAAVCSPSRCVLMTGLHTGHCRVRGNGGQRQNIPPEEEGQRNRIPLEPDDVTIAEVLRRAGYTTGLVGKWGLGEPGSTGLPHRQGFDESIGFLNNDHADNYYTPFLWRNGAKYELPGNAGKAGPHYATDVFTEHACRFVRANKDRPFYLYLAYTAPHLKLEVPELGEYAGRDWPLDEKVYAAMIDRMDRGIGAVLDLLDELGLADNTVVFFSSDNGGYAGNGRFRFNSNAGFRGRKGSLYEGGLRVPMLVRWPGHVKPGVNTEAVWYFADVLPTLADLAGAAPPGKTDGVSVLPTLLGRPQNLSERFLYWEQPYGGFRQAARRGDWKVVRGGIGKKLELYNLATDVAETTNVAGRHPEVVRTFERYLATARTESPNWPVKK